jgi:hypothetical protein
MSENVNTSLIVSVTVVAVIVLVLALRRVVVRREWDRPATTVFLFAVLSTSFVNILVTLLDQWTDTLDPFHNVVIGLPAWAYQLQLGFYVIVLAGALIILVRNILRPGATIAVPALLILLLVMLSDASALLHGDNVLRPYYLIFLAVIAASTVSPRGMGVHLGIGTFAVILAIASGFAVLVNYKFVAFSECDADKCGALGVLFRGVFDNENALALYLAIAMPFVFIAFGVRIGTVLSAYLLLLVLITGSRSGMVAAAVTFVLLVVVRPSLNKPDVSTARIAILYTSLSVAFVLGMVLPFVVDDPQAATGRAYLWILARSALTDGSNLLFGSGALGWEHLRETGKIDYSAVYSVHNQWLQVLFSTGICGMILVIAAVVLLIKQAGRRYSLVVGCVLLPVMCLSVTERPWAIDSVDWLVWALPAALTCYPARGGSPNNEQAEMSTDDAPHAAGVPE